ncbi:probable G-protein coupled receptor 151 [Rhinatrema bivittatum]|uniref:probable G-protein coupled receptor 151 n=1 Tax=Rhinatrema bivittatum TaxID=194408 RepID=UPI001129A73F|nr:probable G-protein coupled receptor 151 [Rhinatrema bivittatum]
MEKLCGQSSNFSTTNSSALQPLPPHYAGGYQPCDSREGKVLVPALMVGICLAGFAGNLCVIGILLHHAKKGKPSLIHSLILNLSLADLFLLAFAVPFRAAAYSRTSWNLGWFVCKTSDWFVHSCLGAKSVTIAIVAKACFMYASDPSKQVNMKHQTILAVLVPVWLVAVVLPLPEWFFTTTKKIEGTTVCISDIPTYAHELMSAFVKFYPFLVFCIPFLLAFFYFWKAYAQCQRRGTKTQNLRNQIRSRRLTIMLLSVTVTFSIMWLPEWISWLWIWHPHQFGPSPPQAFTAAAQLLMFAISSVNPLIFLVMSEEFREGFKGLWKRLASKKSAATPDSPKTQHEHSEALPESDHSQGQPTQPTPTPEAELPCSPPSPGSPENKKEMPVLPDVEQFWHERETLPSDPDNDPTPWEHQDQETVGCNK